MSIKICPKCGKSFNCEGDKDCWCESVQLHRAAVQEIMESFTDCICEECLKAYEDQ